MSVCIFNSLPNAEYLNLLIEAAFSDKFSFSKITLPHKISYLSTFPDAKAKISAVCLYKFH